MGAPLAGFSEGSGNPPARCSAAGLLTFKYLSINYAYQSGQQQAAKTHAGLYCNKQAT
jgi:hypothetical protein